MQQQPNGPQALTLTVNGQELSVQAPSLAALLRHLDLNDAAVVAEVNGVIVARENFAHSSLRDGDTIELVRFVGGG